MPGSGSTCPATLTHRSTASPMSASMPAATSPNSAAPSVPVSDVAIVSICRPCTDALIWFHTALRAPPPESRTSSMGTSAAAAHSASRCRAENATPSRIASAMWRSSVEVVRPRNSPRASGFHSGARSPARWGRNTRACGSRRASSAIASSSCADDAKQRVAQSSASPPACVGPAWRYLPPTGANEMTPRVGTLRSDRTPMISDVPATSIACPGRTSPEPYTLPQASMVPTATGTPGGRPTRFPAWTKPAGSSNPCSGGSSAPAPGTSSRTPAMYPPAGPTRPMGLMVSVATSPVSAATQ